LDALQRASFGDRAAIAAHHPLLDLIPRSRLGQLLRALMTANLAAPA
jgi:hypothetical protein